MYKISMSILQIGELANKLTEEFKGKYVEIPWVSVINIRHRMAYDYDESDVEIIWRTAMVDLPSLEEYCVKILNEVHNGQ